MAGFIVATFVNYLLSIKFVFTSGARFMRFTEILMVYLVSSVGLVVHIVTLYTLIDFLQFDKMISKIMAIGCAFAFNFVLRKFFVFKTKKI
ncbi:MAG: GtrA family protein [Bacteroidota bacterium]|nr:GtrA family protein [Bacteroidota bacterium]